VLFLCAHIDNDRKRDVDVKNQHEENKELEKTFAKIAGKHIRMKRIALGLTLEELAERTGGDDKHLGKLERGIKTPGGFTLFNIFTELDLNPEAIIHELKKEKERYQK